MLLRALGVVAVASAAHVWRLYHSRRQRSNEQVVPPAQGQQEAVNTQQTNETNEPKSFNNQDIDAVAAAAAKKPVEPLLEENLQRQLEESQSQSEEEETQFQMTLNSEPIDTPTPPSLPPFSSSITTLLATIPDLTDSRTLAKASLNLDSNLQERALSSPLDTTTTNNQRYRTAAEAIMAGKSSSSDQNNPFSLHHHPPTLPLRPPLWSGAPGVMPRLSEEVEQSAHSFGRGADSTRSSLAATDDARLAIRLNIISGPAMDLPPYISQEDTIEVTIGRLSNNILTIDDSEVSGHHLSIRWSTAQRCWQVADLGSLNGTRLNGELISVASTSIPQITTGGGGTSSSIPTPSRRRGEDVSLSSDDILQLGSYTQIKVSMFPRDLLNPNHILGSLPNSCLPNSSLPRSLTLLTAKHRIPSFTSLSPTTISNKTPTVRKAAIAAASDELRLECCIASRTGRDHMRKGQQCEDVACADCPLPRSQQALMIDNSNNNIGGGGGSIGGNNTSITLSSQSQSTESLAALFCIFDGHCGREAADAASTALPDEVSSRLPGAREALISGEGVAELLHDAFLATDDRIAAEQGCTATAILAWNLPFSRDSTDTVEATSSSGEQQQQGGVVCLQAANVGDSSALYIDPQTARWKELTEDHRLTNEKERKRLTDMGIQLTDNSRRLYGLNLSRCLGDRFLKDGDLGLSAEPHLSEVVKIPPNRGAIILIASDGLWDVADPETVAAAVCQADAELDGSIVGVANAAVAAAVKRNTKDDVTVLAVRVWPSDEWEYRSPCRNLDDGRDAAFES